MKKIILASASPRRADLLKKTGLKFRIIPSKIKEKVDSSLSPVENARKLSRLKAWDVAAKISQGIVIAADTLVVLKGKILGKPKNKEQAKKMLQSQSGREHQVITAISVIETESRELKQKTVTSKVKFRDLSENLIDQYLAEVDPLDKAGAYAIQEKGFLLIDSIKGDYYNVVGLPLNALNQLLKDFGRELF